jgi:hypothetical protein
MYYRVPLDGYNEGYDTWQSLTDVVAPGTLYPELCARVAGRTQDSERSVIGYRVSRLQPGEENSPHLWVELEPEFPDLDITDESITETGDYIYAIEAIFPGNMYSEAAFSNELYVEYNSAEDEGLILVTELSGNYPNPFNPVTTIQFSISIPGHVQLDIYNVKGQLVKTLVNASLEPDRYKLTWEGTDNKNREMSNGVYFYRLRTDSYTKTKKMILLK